MSLLTNGPRSRKGHENGPYFVAGSGDSAHVVYRRDDNPANTRMVVAHAEGAALIARVLNSEYERWRVGALGGHRIALEPWAQARLTALADRVHVDETDIIENAVMAYITEAEK